jgi:hypothetical protein
MKRALGIVSSSLRLAAGSLAFAATGRTPPSAYQHMIRLFTLTGGRSNDLASRWLSALHPPKPVPAASGVLGDLSGGKMAELDAQLRRDGYVLFPAALPPALCDRLLEFAMTQPCKRRQMDGETAPATEAVYDRVKPTGVVYDFHPQALIHNPDIQSLMQDASILGLAQSYLAAQPVLDTVNLWWTAAQGARPDSSAAQLWHFDMDRLRWIKFFVYLTDVGPHSGPHCFVRASHGTDGIPRELLDRGYVRLSDADVARLYPADAVRRFTAPRGSIIAEDTRGLHKGEPVLGGDRLMLEFEFSNSLFGGAPWYQAKLTQFRDAEFKAFVLGNRRVFSRWL